MVSLNTSRNSLESRGPKNSISVIQSEKTNVAGHFLSWSGEVAKTRQQSPPDSLLFFLPLYPQLLLLLFLLAHQAAVLGENLGGLGGRVGARGAF